MLTATRLLAVTAAGFISAATISDAAAQTPKRGGMVTAGYEGGEPAHYDCHAAALSLAFMYFLEPHHALLVRYDTANYPKIEGDVAESWTVSPDGLTYTFKIRPNVKFHDGTPLTAEDVKASYDRIRNPPAGIVSPRKDAYRDIESITVNDPLTVSFKLSRPDPATINSFASPFNCIYSARRLAADQNSPRTTVVGAGPYVFGTHAAGQSWEGRRFDGYFRPGQPYLDQFKIVIFSAGAGATAFAGGQIDMLLRVLSPQEINTIRSARADRVKFTTTSLATSTQITFNSGRKPFDDARVRRALSLAIDRYGGLEPMTKITNLTNFGGMMRPGSENALSDDELAKLPGFTRDINAARAEARRLLAEAGQSDLKFKLLNRAISPYSQLGIFAVDQWRQIGVTAEINVVDAPPYLAAQSSGDYDAAVTANSLADEEPSAVLVKFVPGMAVNTGYYNDAQLVDLFNKQSVTRDAAERKRLINEFDRRMAEQAYVAQMYWAGWTSATASDIQGWRPTPLFYVGYDMGSTWRQ